MASVKNFILPFSVLMIFVSLMPVHQSTAKKDNCEYDMDLTRNVIKITCDGSASSVNVYADTAHVSGDEDFDGADGPREARGGNPDNPSRYTGNGNDDDDDDDNGGKQRADTTRGRTNKEIRGNTPGSQYVKMSADHGDDGTRDSTEQDSSAFADVVWNATQKLDDARRKLSTYSVSLKNITNKLQEGDLFLRRDMDNLRKTSNQASELKEGLIVAMKNQYNFMRSALLTHNYELLRVMDSLDVLVNVTSHGFHNALMAHRSDLQQIHRLNTTLTSIKKMVSSELKRRYRRRGIKKGNNTKTCPKVISAIGSGFSRQLDSADGSYMVESYSQKISSAVWVMKGSESNDQIIQYDTPTDITYGIVAQYFALPFSCRGTGHVVFRRHFYCHVKDTNSVMKYHLKKMDIVSEVILPGTNYQNYPYRAAANNEVDLAVDEMGLWAIYASDESRGKIIISKINHSKMEIEKSWATKVFKTDVGNAFMICGNLYATNSHSDSPTYIKYVFYTDTNRDLVLESGKIPFANAADLLSGSDRSRTHRSANSVMLSYDFKTSMLYSWSNSYVESFPVYFKKPEDAI